MPKAKSTIQKSLDHHPPDIGDSLSWRAGTLSDIVEVNPKTDTDHLDDDDPVTFLPMECISEDGRILDRRTRPYAEVKTGYTTFRPGDVLFPKITPCMENGKGAIASDLVNNVGFGSTEYFVLRPKPGVSSEFVFQVTRLPSFREIAVRYMSGSAGQQRVQKDIFFTHPIALPPMREQRHISAILATFDETIAVLNAVIAAIEEVEAGVAESLFLSLQGSETFNHDRRDAGPGDSWPTVTLAEILSEKLTAGYSGLETHDEDGVNCLTLSAVTNNDISLRHTKKIVADRARVSDIWIRKDDIFIERSNNYDLVGLSSIYEGDEPFAIFPDLLIRVRVDTEMARPKFVARYLRSKSVRAYFVRCAKGTSGSMKKIDQRIVGDVRIPLPPLAEQRRIVDIFSTLDDRLALERAERDRLVALKKGLMQVLLTGKVRLPPGVAEGVAPAHA